MVRRYGLQVGTVAVGITLWAILVIGAPDTFLGAGIQTCRKLIDDLKAQVPIWKNQSFGDGDTEWVGSP